MILMTVQVQIRHATTDEWIARQSNLRLIFCMSSLHFAQNLPLHLAYPVKVCWQKVRIVVGQSRSMTVA